MDKNPFAIPTFGQTTSPNTSGTATTSQSSAGSPMFRKLFPPSGAQSSGSAAGASGSGSVFGGQQSVFGMQPSRVFGQSSPAAPLSSFPVGQSASSISPAKTTESSASSSLFGKKDPVPDNPFKLKAVGTPAKNLFGTSPNFPATGRNPIKSQSDSAVAGQGLAKKRQAFQFSTAESPQATGKTEGTVSQSASNQADPAPLFGGQTFQRDQDGDSQGKFAFSPAKAGAFLQRRQQDIGFGAATSRLASRALAGITGSRAEGRTSGFKRQSEISWTDAESGEKRFRNIPGDPAGAPLGWKGEGDIPSGSTDRFQAMQEARAAPLPDDDDDDDDDNESISSQSTERSGSYQLRRMSSVTEDLSDRTYIECKHIPAKYNKGSFLRKHFQKFGRVERVVTNPQKSSAAIRFADHESAKRAKSSGRSLGPGVPKLQIFWRNTTSSRRSSQSASTSASVSRPEPQEEAGHAEPQKSPHKRSSGLFASSEVEDELASMAGYSDVQSKSTKPLRRTPASRLNFSDLAKQAQGYKSQSLGASQQSGTSVTQESFTRTASARQPSPPPEHSASKARRTEASASYSPSTLSSSVAKTVGERFQMLDVRDKMIRQSRKKQDNYATARAFVGTCPDMCPEKERYDREDKRRLHAFEILPGTDLPGQNPLCDHARAVKEYSRSSADQEEPLPQELRPLPVLVTTMKYLLSEIADRGEDGKWADWFHFVWDRTRGIRKDITQQQLSSEEAAELLEKCARFHIFCAHRLCEEDMSAFDAKINNENLTKCLQTLKEFYDDLAKGQVFCRHEAEFRAYVVLMNINEGDTLREVQQLRSEVLNSAAIDFAVRTYLAVNNNNYVLFFRLVKQASFLNACLMHRYFTQVRSKALLTMIKAYRSSNSKFPLEDMVRMLAFEGEAEAVDFCQNFGLPCEEGAVKLDFNCYIQPESALLPRRAIHLIESKQQVSIGEVISGEPMPPFTLPRPTFSFDDQGRLVDSAKMQVVESQGDSIQQPSLQTSPFEQKPRTLTQEEQTSSHAAAAPVRVTGEAIKLVAKELFLEVIDDIVMELSTQCHQGVQKVLALSVELQESLLAPVSSAMIRQLAEEVMEGEQRRVQEAAREEHRQCVEHATLALAVTLVEEVMAEEVKVQASTHMKEVEAELRRQCRERAVVAVGEEMVEGAVTALVWELAAEVFERDVVQRRQALAAAQSAVELRRTGKFLLMWRKQLAARLRRRRAMATFPCAPPQVSLQDQLKALLPDRADGRMQGRRIPLTRTGGLAVELPMEMEQRELRLAARLSLLALKRHLDAARAWQPLSLPSLVSPALHQVLHQIDLQGDHGVCLLWKLVVSLPEAGEGEDGEGEDEEGEKEERGHVASRTLQDWLKARLSRGSPGTISQLSGKSKLWSLYSADLAAAVPVRLGVCVRSVQGILGEVEVEEAESQRTLLGTSGLLLLLEPLPGASSEEDMYWLEATLRLARLLQAKPMQPPLPLVVLVPHPPGEPPSLAEVRVGLELERYQRQGLLVEFHLLPLPLDPSHTLGVNVEAPTFTQQLSEGLTWLASHIKPQPRLEVRTLRMLVEDTILAEFSCPVLHNLHLRRAAGFLHQPMRVLLELYNAVVKHLASVLSRSNLARLSWPIPEFSHSSTEVPPPHWNTGEHLSWLRETTLGLALPEWCGCWEKDDSWSQVCQDIWHYVELVVGNTTGSACVSLATRVKSLLRRVEEEFAEVCWLLEGEAHCVPTAANVPWTEVLQACVSFRLSTLPCTEEGQELVVAYDQSELDNFHPPALWSQLSHQPDPVSSVGMLLNETVAEAVERHRLEMRNPPSSASTSPSSEESPALPQGEGSGRDWLEGDRTPSHVAEVRASLDQLSSRMQRLKAEEGRYEDYLRSVLNDSSPTEGRLTERGRDLLVRPQPNFQLGTEGDENSLSPSPPPRYPRHGNTLDSKMEALLCDIESNKKANELFLKKLEVLASL